MVRSEHAVRFWVNDPRKPLIDAQVRSGSDTEHRGSIYLLAGRSYPVRLEFFKALQGVQKKDTSKPIPASVSLEWKTPRGVVCVIPGRYLSPTKGMAESYVLETPFPPDDRSLGWERGNTVSKEWDAATTDAAIDVAGYVVTRLPELSGVQDATKDRGPRLREFCRKFAERAFRRPLTADQIGIIEKQFEAAKDPETAVKRVVLLVLKSPRFLYREVGEKHDDYDVAARLSFSLWDSIPDQALLSAAAAGKLHTLAEVKLQAERMLADPRARAKLRDFLLTYLKADQAPELAKDPKRYPGFDAAVAADLRTSLELFLDDVLASEGADFRRLVLAEDVFLNGRLAKLYGGDVPADADFRKVVLDQGKRAGVLTHPYLLATFAYTADSSPVHRGVFIARGILGLGLRPPPEAFTPSRPICTPA